MTLSDVLNERQWTQAILDGARTELGQQPLCLVLAVREFGLVTGKTRDERLVMEASLLAIVERLWPERVATYQWPRDASSTRVALIAFNDDPRTTWPDIAKLFREYELEIQS